MVGGRVSVALFVSAFLFVGLVSAVNVDFDCPNGVFVDEEFECSLEVFDGDGEYDVKVDLDGERDSVLEIWNEDGDEWLSGYYYLREFVEDEEEVDVRLRVSEEGRYDGVLKLRQGDKREFFQIEMRVRRPKVEVEGGGLKMEDEEEVVVFREARPMVEIEGGGLRVEGEVILLNGDVVEEVDEVVYESKNSFVGGWLIYGFALFLIFVIFVLVWERKN